MDYTYIKMELPPNGWVGDVIDDIVQIIKKGGNIFISAPPGLGKSTASLRLREYFPAKNITFGCPTQVLVGDLGKNHKLKDKGIPFGHGVEFIQQAYRSGYLVTTWDSAQIWDRADIDIIDEAHLIAGHASFREIARMVLGSKRQKIFMSGTPEIIRDWDGIDHYIEIQTTQRQKEVTIVQASEDCYDLASYYADKSSKNWLTIIRLNSKEKAQRLYDQIKRSSDNEYKRSGGNERLTRNVAMIYSDRHELNAICGEDVMDQLRRGKVPSDIDILITTSILDTGVSLDSERAVKAYAISNNRGMMPNGIDMIQFLNRIRSDKGEMELTIVGNYPKDAWTLPRLDEYKISGGDNKSFLHFSSNKYELYRQLDKTGYFSLFERYNILANEGSELLFTKSSPRGKRDIQIITNLGSWEKTFEEIEYLCQLHNRSAWAQKVSGEEFNGEKPPTRALSLSKEFMEAVECGLHHSVYITERYEKRRRDLLCQAAKERSAGFRMVLNELLQEVDLKSGQVYKMCTGGYKGLIKNQQDMIREVARLFYTGEKWNRQKISLKRRSHDENLAPYLSILINGLENHLELAG